MANKRIYDCKLINGVYTPDAGVIKQTIKKKQVKRKKIRTKTNQDTIQHNYTIREKVVDVADGVHIGLNFLNRLFGRL